jgi:hypothetical protein
VKVWKTCDDTETVPVGRYWLWTVLSDKPSSKPFGYRLAGKYDTEPARSRVCPSPVGRASLLVSNYRVGDPGGSPTWRGFVEAGGEFNESNW